MPRTDAALAGEAAAATPIGRSAPAKINLALAVRGRRDDGYHLLQSLAVFTRLADRVAVQEASEDSFAASGPFASAVPAGDGNLVLAARDALRAAFPGRLGPVAIRLDKVLPVAAGIGGGSSDAAAALRALASLAGIGAGPRLGEIGLELGADVPMCLAARPLMAEGIGETIAPLDGFPALPLVLANPGVAVSDGRRVRGLAGAPERAAAAAASILVCRWARRVARRGAQRSGAAGAAARAGHRRRARSAAAGRRAAGAHVRVGRHLLRALRQRCRGRSGSGGDRPQRSRVGGSRRRRASPRETASMAEQERPFVPVGIAVLTVSDTRRAADDRSGDTLAERIVAAGHRLAGRAIVTDDATAIREAVEAWSRDPAIDVVITTGGTGFTGRDVTPEALEPLFEKRMEGFSAVFHRISYDKIGTSTIQSRATGGIVNQTFVFVLPGSPGACRDAWDGILAAQLDYRHRPCNFVEIMPRLDEHLKRG